jgi:hypothetical protein
LEGLGSIAAAAAAFVSTHFLLSHPLRKPLVDATGNAAFLGIYSAVAAVTLGWLALAYRAAPAGAPLWSVGDGLWAAATAVMLLASILLMGSLVRMVHQTCPRWFDEEVRPDFRQFFGEDPTKVGALLLSVNASPDGVLSFATARRGFLDASARIYDQGAGYRLSRYPNAGDCAASSCSQD